MSLSIRAYSNSNDAFVVWRSDSPIADCIGFELRRIQNGTTTIVNNRVSFSAAGADPQHPASSSTSPLRRYSWTDHGQPAGSVLRYQVAPVIQAGTAAAAVDESLASPISDPVTITGDVGNGFECYFNRGMIMSQFMSKFLNNDLSDKSLKAFKASLNADPDTNNNIRTFLGGPLRAELIKLLDETAAAKGHVYAAIFELADELMLEKLKALGKNAHIILSNGAHKSVTDDENAPARKELAGICDVYPRMLATGYLAHNKFAIFTDATGKPQTALSGSTNWSPTGLCTQMNNGIVFDDATIAQIFLDQWNRLKDASGTTPATTPSALIQENQKVKSVPAKNVDIWFTRSSSSPEMKAVCDLVAKAEEGVLFLMFMPGGSIIEDAILKVKSDKPNAFVKGVISTMNSKDETKASVELVSRNGKPVPPMTVIQPAGIDKVGDWLDEVSRGAFLHDIGFAIVHSKVVVIDPNGANPVVVTGSHNFSASASTKNDENLVIIRNNPELARAYAVNIQSVYDSYSFAATAKLMAADGKNVADVMKDPKSWQASWFQGDRALELDFWFGTMPAPVAVPPTPAKPADTAAKASSTKTAKKSGAKATKGSTAKTPAKKAAKKAPAKKVPAKAVKQAPAKKPVTKVAAKKAVAKKAPAKKAAKKAPAKKAVAKKVPAKKAVKKAVAKKAPLKKTATKKTPAKKAAKKKSR